jgi:MIP family channel proteins
MVENILNLIGKATSSRTSRLAENFVSRETERLSETPSLEKRMLAEFIGTYMFVFVGAGSAVGSFVAFGFTDPGVGLLIAALGNGVGLGVAISATLGISGGALNPAVAIGLLVGGKLPPKDVIGYIVSEVIGAILAAFSLVAVSPLAYGNSVSWGAPVLSNLESVSGGFAMELILTFFLVFVVYGTIVESRSQQLAGLAVGLLVLVDVFIGGPLTGAAMNPARATGPLIAAAIFSKTGSATIWIIDWTAPFIGAIIAGFAWRAFKATKTAPSS